VEKQGGRAGIRFTKDSRVPSAGNDPSFDFTSDFTVAARVKLAGDAGDVTLVSKRGDNGADGWALVHGIRGLGGLGFVAAPRVVMPTPVKAFDEWTHVAVTFHDQSLLLYVNGKAIGVCELPVVPKSSAAPLRLGGDADGKHVMDGWLDDVRIYHRGLTADEVEKLAAGQEPANPYSKLTADEEKRARALIKELGADAYARREQAAAELRQMGRKVFPLLREYRDSEDLEVSLRIKGILGELPRSGGGGGGGGGSGSAPGGER
jgi:hypothetical protein